MGVSKVLLALCLVALLATCHTMASSSSESDSSLVDASSNDDFTTTASQLIEVESPGTMRGAKAPGARKKGILAKVQTTATKVAKKAQKLNKKANKVSKKAKKLARKAAKATKKAAKATKKAGKLGSKKAKKQARKAVKKAKKAVKKALKATKKSKTLRKKASKLAQKANAKVSAALGKLLKRGPMTPERVKRILARVVARARATAKRLKFNAKKTAAFIAAQKKKVLSRLFPTKASKIKDAKVKRLIRGVKKTQSREAISKLQAALKKKKAGSVVLPIKHHKITVHPRTPRAKKLKIHKESPTDKNYVKHLKKTARALKKKIRGLKHSIHKAGLPVGKQDWPIEYATLDPPDKGAAAAAQELYQELKPFLKDAPAIQEKLLTEGKEGLVTMEALRWEVHDKLEKAKSQPLLPEMYRFIE